MLISGLRNQFIYMNHLFFIGDNMDMLQIPTMSVDLVEQFNSLNVEFKVLIAIIAIPLCMVLIYIVFKLIEILFLLLKVILDGFLNVFRKSSEIKGKIRINNEKSEASEDIDSKKQEKDKEYEVDASIDSIGEEEKEPIISEEGESNINIKSSINRSKNPEFTSENSTRLINCPNCGKKFSLNSYSKIGDTLFVSCEECGKRYIIDGEDFSEN